MKKVFPLILCFLALPSFCCPQAAPKLAPEVRAFVKEDAPLLALTHVRVIDGTGSAPRADQTLIIRDGKISALGDAAATKIPEGAKVLDLAGRTVIPGLVGMHDHMFYPAPGGPPPLYPEHAASFPRLYLAGGVTTIRTTGSVDPYADLELKHAIDDGKMAGPKIHVTGPYLEGQGAFTLQMHQLKDAEDARRMVEFWITQGATSFKAYQNITPEELAAAVKAAHAHGLKVTGHLCSIGFREAAALGIDDLEHGLVVDTEFLPDKKPGECPSSPAARKALLSLEVASGPIHEMIRDLVNRHVAITSTLPVFEISVPGRAPLDARILDAMLPDERVYYLRRRAVISDGAAKSDWPALFKKELEFEREFVKQGGLLLAGLDPTGYGGVIAGFGDQREVELLVEAGFTPVEAIHIATSNGAEFLGELDKIGTLAPGKLADIIVIDGDPSGNIKDIEKIDIVFKDGVGYDSAKLIESARGQVGLR
ncbi:MAG TPA: amidohydrolase family protein [Candidatus Acidoferrum sp.]|jgi:imidazolonepropionase-like amidohydrolase|nr:amidohydrolase family protein [Candidatus Acidoferrum sp.]